MSTDTSIQQHEVIVEAGEVGLDGLLSIPERCSGAVLFAHGSGSSRFSPRNQLVAKVLQEAGLATLLLDLLTQREDEIDARTPQRFDIGLLSRRLVDAIDWIKEDSEVGHIPVGLFGASTGAGAALVAAAERPQAVKAVVSRGGRPDLAGNVLPRVEAPTLLIVGGKDTLVIQLNQEAASALHCEKHLAIVEGATHLFEEAGKLEEVSQLARDWFAKHVK